VIGVDARGATLQPIPFQQYPSQGRPPADGECRFCGSTPATRVAIQSVVGLILAYQVTTHRGWVCRDCGLALFRDETARTLKFGWWSLTSLAVVPIFLLINLIRWGKLARLAPPRPSLGVLAPNPRPAVPGPPMFRRPVALMLVLALPFVFVIFLCVGVSLTS
jgi:hypothetical protein